MGFELMTSSLPRMRSTPELHRLLWSGRRGSNSRPSAWKADALPTELLPQIWWGEVDSNHRTRRSGFTVRRNCRYAIPPSCSKQFKKARAERGIRTHDPEITNHVLWPTELFRRYFKDTLCKRDCKDRDLIRFSKTFSIIFIEPQEL